MADNPFNAASMTSGALAAASPATNQFINFSGQNNPFNPQPPKPTSISNVSGNQFTLDIQKAGQQTAQQLSPAQRGSPAVPTVQPLTYDVRAGQAGATMPKTNINPAIAGATQPPAAPNAYSTSSPEPNQQQGLIRGAIGRQ